MRYIIDTDKLPCNNGKNCTTCPFWSVDNICEITEQVKKLPKYEERPHEEWETCIDTEYCKCSYCGKVVMLEESVRFHFCPNCGANMRGETK